MGDVIESEAEPASGLAADGGSGEGPRADGAAYAQLRVLDVGLDAARGSRRP